MNKNGILKNYDTGIEETYTMRIMGKKDINDILELQERVLLQNSFNSHWFFPYSKKQLNEITDGKSNIAIGVYAGGRLVAFRAGCFFGEEYDDIIEALGERYKKIPCFVLNGIFVDKAYRRNHLQQDMTEHSFEECRERGIHMFVGVVHPENTPSIQSLIKLGFEERTRHMVYDGKYDRLVYVKEEH